MVFTDLRQHRLLRLGHLAGQLHLQPLGRQLDRRQRVLDLVRQPARHLAPGLRALGRDDLGDVVEHQQPRRSPRQLGARAPRAITVIAAAGAPGCAGVQLEGLLPVVEAVLLALDGEVVELLLHGLRRIPPAPAPPTAAGLRTRPAARAGCAWRRGWSTGCGPARPARSRRPSGCPGWSAGWRARRSPAPMLCSTAPRASASCCVMSANERVRPPSSSLPCSTGLGDRSPAATSRTPAASSSSGRASWLPSSTASSTAPNTARNRLSVSVPMYMRRRPSRASARSWYSRLASCTASALATSVGRQALRDLQEARLGQQAEARLRHQRHAP